MKLSNYSTGQQLSGHLAVKKCNIRQTNQTPQKDYLDMLITDGETDIVARVWDHSGPVPQVNSVIHVTATINQYRGDNQLNISEWRQANQGEYNPKNFLPVCPHDLEKLWGQLREVMAKIMDLGLVQILSSVFSKHYKQFQEAPAALYHHGAYLGGLLEHTCGVVEQCLRLATEETDINLLITGAILHDIGKIFDYDWSGCVITMTDAGQLLGHISQGMMLINSHAVNCPDLSTERLNLLLHLIASHHGKLEWGSPVEPSTREAILLHNADMLDVQLWKLAQAQAKTPTGEKWTEKVWELNNKRFWVGVSETTTKEAGNK